MANALTMNYNLLMKEQELKFAVLGKREVSGWVKEFSNDWN